MYIMLFGYDLITIYFLFERYELMDMDYEFVHINRSEKYGFFCEKIWI